MQDQQPELERFSDTLSREPSREGGAGVAHDTTSKAPKQDPEAGLEAGARAGAGAGAEAGAGAGACRSSLNRQSSALTWSQRQQLRRDSAAVRSAAASRHVATQENRRAPGGSPPLFACYAATSMKHLKRLAWAPNVLQNGGVFALSVCVPD